MREKYWKQSLACRRVLNIYHDDEEEDDDYYYVSLLESPIRSPL